MAAVQEYMGLDDIKAEEMFKRIDKDGSVALALQLTAGQL